MATRADTRVQKHADEAQEVFRNINQQISRIAQANPDAEMVMPPGFPDAHETHSYDCMLTIAGVYFTAVTADLKEAGSSVGSVSGMGGGLILGVGQGWGTAWLNFPYREIKGRSGSFQANIAAVVMNINWWLDDGTFVGSAVTGGYGTTGGVVGGSCKFD
ncbi:hypothetical protein MRQ36_12950 [Micromonospora sp. R77]|uniref:hypothetical protein n=1 Tax=Micromonospora sp. R77 TaxID=2925836 RepID=UPI001F60CCCA|nr:hypothetical protein [Micromonospora sp. R77]MCI4063435.1 hypothetical protein [Micromonospora sp. R77]